MTPLRRRDFPAYRSNDRIDSERGSLASVALTGNWKKRDTHLLAISSTAQHRRESKSMGDNHLNPKIVHPPACIETTKRQMLAAILATLFVYLPVSHLTNLFILVDYVLRLSGLAGLSAEWRSWVFKRTFWKPWFPQKFVTSVRMKNDKRYQALELRQKMLAVAAGLCNVVFFILLSLQIFLYVDHEGHRFTAIAYWIMLALISVAPLVCEMRLQRSIKESIPINDEETQLHQKKTRKRRMPHPVSFVADVGYDRS